MYRYLRFFVFGIFVLSNVVASTSAVWNLSLIQASGPSSMHSQNSDIYSIFMGCAGLALIFPILFCDLAAKDLFLTKVWFEVIWVAVFCILNLAGAAVATAVGFDYLCQRLPPAFNDPDSDPRCISSRLLQGFLWSSSLCLLCYFLLLAVSTLLKYRNDSTIWHCHVRQFPWLSCRFRLGSAPSSPAEVLERKSSKMSLPRFRRHSKPPIIAAPRPRHAGNQAAIREAILSYRSGLSMEYEVEHYRPEIRPIPRPELAVLAEDGGRPAMRTQDPGFVTFATSMYPEHMRRALASMQPPISDSQTEDQRPSGSPPSPSPIGNWPQLNPPVRRPGDRQRNNTFPLTLDGAQPSTSTSPQHTVQFTPFSASRHGRTRSGGLSRELSSPPSASKTSPTYRTRPGGPRRPSIDDTARRTSHDSRNVLGSS
ncbi:hypothetical protein FA15DRAFT_663119 [Coprinopsis marcescibilis]|uniref:Uncharacterized protein n=1 Tax=Coprinopsis marcescibilis TaxID=230819 RepID=A0A5C3L9X5_COPMA|nr:hypothetical protein FA15DRAFT_663119 [Coprinopsis marcescibilis]